MSKKNVLQPIKTEIVSDISFQILGCVFYGDPFHSAKGWSEENEIGLTWIRFMELYEQYEDIIQKYRINPNETMEIHIEPKEYKKDKKFYVFVGIKVSKLKEMPIEMFSKVLPLTKYVKFTFKGKYMFQGSNYIWKDWFPNSDYQESYPYLIQVYDETRFLGMDNEDSELDYYVPIKKK
jgi:AraC family transcriptional regulator